MQRLTEMARRSVSPLELDTFFETAKSPSDYEPSLEAIRAFIKVHEEAGRRVVVITSGGTIVPLERQMIRFLDNFSAGTRGAISAEYLIKGITYLKSIRWFLRAGYAVIYLHRQYSFAPFSRKFRAKDESILTYLESDGDSVQGTNLLRKHIKLYA